MSVIIIIIIIIISMLWSRKQAAFRAGGEARRVPEVVSPEVTSHDLNSPQINSISLEASFAGRSSHLDLEIILLSTATAGATNYH